MAILKISEEEKNKIMLKHKEAQKKHNEKKVELKKGVIPPKETKNPR